ncbi:MAG: periplasmic heavy metal sensor [Fulvivirga sp.]|uniref:Spy/CpxP family protein refolding chaperone n=1 Tax=Fulvivirga sp. TaxID=1931237 RepID=UPI0032EB055F
MKRNRFLIATIVVLVVINLITLTLLWNMNKGFDDEDPRRHRHEMFFERKLGLNDEQIEKFEEARRKHFEKMKSINREIRELRNEMSSLMKERKENEAKEIISKIGTKYEELELANFDHFRELRSYCNPTQQQIFDSVMNKVTSHPRRRGHGRH